MAESKKYMWLLVVCGVVVLALYLGSLAADRLWSSGTSSRDPSAFVPPPGAPPRSASNTTAVEAQKPFDIAVSYTDAGFTPARAALPRGKTVRFTNNSSAPMRITIASMSAELKSGEYMHYTFSEAGSSNVSDILKPDHSAAIVIQ